MGTAKKLLDWSTGCTKASTAAVLPIIALFILIIAVIAGS